jgi:hypothetical protein
MCGCQGNPGGQHWWKEYLLPEGIISNITPSNHSILLQITPSRGEGITLPAV